MSVMPATRPVVVMQVTECMLLNTPSLPYGRRYLHCGPPDASGSKLLQY
jgi:hypothetical protein